MIERNPRYDGLHVFKLDLNAMQPGDVILTRNAEAATAKGNVRPDRIRLVGELQPRVDVYRATNAHRGDR